MVGDFGRHALKPLQQRLLRCAQSAPANWLGRRAALILRKIVLLTGQPVIDAEVDGLKLRLYMTDNVSERKFLFMPQFFDAYERGLMKKLLKEGSTFVDIGANAGIYTMTAAALVGASGRVLSIEPNPKVLERLSFNAALNGFESRITIEQAGVSDTAGSFALTLDASNLGGSSLVLARGGDKIDVRCDTLLSIVTKNGLRKINAIKIDIEGAEDKALIPFFRDAPKELYPKLLILENAEKDWKEDLPGKLTRAGYVLLKTTRMNQVWERR